MRLVLIWSHLQIKTLRFSVLPKIIKQSRDLNPRMSVTSPYILSIIYSRYEFHDFLVGGGRIKGIIKWESDQIGRLAYSHRSSVWPWTCISPWPLADPTSLAASVSSSVKEEKGSKGAFQYYDWTVHLQPPRAQTAQRLSSVDGNFPPLSSHKSLGTGSYLSLDSGWYTQ